MISKGMNKLTREGLKAIAQGNPSRARQLLEKAVQDEPDNAAAWQMLASVVPDEADKRRCLWRALECDPQDASVMRDLAVLDGLRRPPSRTAPGTPAAIPSRSNIGAPGPATASPAAPAAPAVARPAAPKTSAGAAAGTGLLTTVAAGRRTTSSSATAPAGGTDDTHEVLRSAMTADDAVAIAAHQRRAAMRSPEAPARQWGMAAVLIVGAICATFLVALAARLIGTGASSDAPSGDFAPSGALAPGAAMVVTTPYGEFAVPGTAFLSGPGPDGMEGQNQAVVPLMLDRASTDASPTCALPYASAVLVLDVWTGSDGRRAFKVQHRDCTGWVAESHLSNAAGSPLSTRERDPGLAPGK